jgi:hypothetical protein
LNKAPQITFIDRSPVVALAARKPAKAIGQWVPI